MEGRRTVAVGTAFNTAEPVDAGFCRRYRERPGAVRLKGLECLAAGLVEHADQVHHARRALQGAVYGRLIANIGLEELDLADIAHHL